MLTASQLFVLPSFIEQSLLNAEVIIEDDSRGSISFSKSGRNGSLAKRASLQTSRSSKGSRGSKRSTKYKTAKSTDAEKSNIKFLAETVERAPATIVQTGRDRLEVTVHPQSLTKTSDKATVFGEEYESDDEDEASDTDSDDETVTWTAVSVDDEASDIEIDEEAVIGEFFASTLAQAGVSHRDVDRVALQIRRTGSSDEEEDSDDDDDDDASASARTIDVTDSSRKPSWETVVNNVLQIIKQLKQFAPESGESKEEQVKNARLLKKLDEVMQICSDPSQIALCCTLQQ